MNAALTTSPLTRTRVDPRVGLALGLVYAIWGSTYLAMRIAVSVLPPWGMAGSRFVVAGSLALILATLRREHLPSARDWLFAVPSGLLLFVVGNGLVAVAEQSVASSVAAVVTATSPLLVAGVNAARGERASKAESFGMVLGLVGVLVLAGSSAILGAGGRGLVLLIAPLGWSLGSVMVRSRKTQATGLAAAAPQMVVGGVAMLVICAASGEHLPAHVPLRAVAAWGYLVIAGSVVGFTCYAWLLRHARPTVALSHAYVNPLVAVLVGAAFGGETVGTSSIVAAVLIAAGVMVAVAARRPSGARPA